MKRKRKTIAILICLFLFILVGSHSNQQNKTIEQTTNQSKNNIHPRIMASSEDFNKIIELINNDTTSKERFNKIKSDADNLLNKEPVKYELPDKIRLLPISREVLSRIQTLGFVYKISGDKKYADRAWLELKTVSDNNTFPDWHPAHFLDTAEMTTAVAIGYDWLYDYLSEEQKRIIRDAILNKGLNEGLKDYDKKAGWTTADTNWNIVCNGGLGVGAIAIRDEGGDYTKVSEDILEKTKRNIPKATKMYGNDGAWYEGTSYWDYSTTYLAYFISSLDITLGNDFGLSNNAGLSKSGDFIISLEGQAGMFNYGDADTDTIKSPSLLWLAQKYNNNNYATYYHSITSVKHANPMDFIWGVRTKVNDKVKKPDSAAFYDTGVAILSNYSSSSNVPKSFVGFKVGKNGVSHSDLDLGSFIYDNSNIRWFLDLGSADYNSDGYWNMSYNGGRWKYYQKRAEGHNTLVINPSKDPDQNIHALAKITDFKDNQYSALVSSDLTEAYNDNASSVIRTIQLEKSTGIVSIEDAIKNKKTSNIYWFGQTQANIQISSDGKTATLSKNNKQVNVRIVSPSNAKFYVTEALPLAKDLYSYNPKALSVNRLSINLTNAEDTSIKVIIIPKQ